MEKIMADNFKQLKEQSHPSLMSKAAMTTAASTRGTGELLFSEILTNSNFRVCSATAPPRQTGVLDSTQSQFDQGPGKQT